MQMKDKIERLLILFCEDIKDYEYESSSCIGKDDRSSEEFVKIFMNSNPTQVSRILSLIKQEQDERIEKVIELIYAIERGIQLSALANNGMIACGPLIDELAKIKNTLTGGK